MTNLVLISEEVLDQELEFQLSCSYSPPTPDVRYLPNGDPGYPGDPEEFEVESIICLTFPEWKISGETEEYLIDKHESEITSQLAEANQEGANYYD